MQKLQEKKKDAEKSFQRWKEDRDREIRKEMQRKKHEEEKKKREAEDKEARRKEAEKVGHRDIRSIVFSTLDVRNVEEDAGRKVEARTPTIGQQAAEAQPKRQPGARTEEEGR